jgi:hypothetical protein
VAEVCPSVLHFCTTRLTKLDPVTGAVVSEADNSYVSDGAISLAFTKEIEAGTESVLKNGCGDIRASSKTPDRMKRWNLTLTMSEFEPGLWSMLTGDDTVESGGDVVGIDGQDQFADDFVETLVALEGWAFANEGDAPDPIRPYFYVLLPATTWNPPDFTLQEEFTTWPFDGFNRTNSSWFTGPYDDTGLSGSVSTYRFAQVAAANVPPTAQCGFQTIAAGT